MPEIFPILVEVEELMVGSVLKLLHRTPGVVNFHLNLDHIGKKPARVPKGEPNGKGTGHSRQKKNPDAPTGSSVIIAELVSGPKNLDHLKSVFTKHGLSVGNVSSTLYTLAQKGITESAGVGLHKLTDAFMERWQQEHPVAASADEVHALPAPEAPKRGESRPLVLKMVGEGKTRIQIVKEAEKLGMTERAIDGALTRLKNDKLIAGVKDQPGVYVLVPQRGGKSKQPATKE